MDSKAYFLQANTIIEIIIRTCVWGWNEWCSERQSKQDKQALCQEQSGAPSSSAIS